MTRDEVLKLFPDATEDQITNFLNKANAELAKEREKAKAYKADADKASELQKKIDELEQGNMTEVEKANKALEAANNKIAELEKSNTLRDQRESAMTNFKITAEQAKTIVKDDGTFDYNALGKIIADKEAAAAQAKEEEIANNSTQPGGGAGGGKDKDNEKTEAEKIAENIGKTMSDTNKSAESVIGNYL